MFLMCQSVTQVSFLAMTACLHDSRGCYAEELGICVINLGFFFFFFESKCPGIQHLPPDMLLISCSAILSFLDACHVRKEGQGAKSQAVSHTSWLSSFTLPCWLRLTFLAKISGLF